MSKKRCPYFVRMPIIYRYTGANFGGNFQKNTPLEQGGFGGIVGRVLSI